MRQNSVSYKEAYTSTCSVFVKLAGTELYAESASSMTLKYL